MASNPGSADIERFYELLRVTLGGSDPLPVAALTASTVWPRRGLYFFFEPGEYRSEGNTPRVTRVGTHAVSANSKATLWTRLRTHRGTGSGGGNHRSSIFRSHLGAALIRAGFVSGDLTTWLDQSLPLGAVRDAEAPIEMEVSRYIATMGIAFLPVDDDPGPRSDRAYLERNSIGLLATTGRRSDPPSSTWIGLHSDRKSIRDSGLWNLDHLGFPYDPRFLEVMSIYAEAANSRVLPVGSMAPRGWWSGSSRQQSFLGQEEA